MPELPALRLPRGLTASVVGGLVGLAAAVPLYTAVSGSPPAVSVTASRLVSAASVPRGHTFARTADDTPEPTPHGSYAARSRTLTSSSAGRSAAQRGAHPAAPVLPAVAAPRDVVTQNASSAPRSAGTRASARQGTASRPDGDRTPDGTSADGSHGSGDDEQAEAAQEHAGSGSHEQPDDESAETANG